MIGLIGQQALDFRAKYLQYQINYSDVFPYINNYTCTNRAALTIRRAPCYFGGDMKTCFLFPGQGAQYPGMARDLWESSARAKDLFQAASDTLGMDMKKLLFDSSEEELKATDKTQVAMTLASLCSSAVLKERGVEPDGVAGFSLGEYAALCEAGVLRMEDVFPIVRVRGELMEKGCARPGLRLTGRRGWPPCSACPPRRSFPCWKRFPPQGSFPRTTTALRRSSCPGTARGLALAEKELKAAGAKRLVRLQVSGPFHSPLLAEARAGFDKALAAFPFADPAIPVYSNVTGKRISTRRRSPPSSAGSSSSPW